MRKSSAPIYVVLVLGLLLLFAIPMQLQNVLRNQFLRPLIPFGRIFPTRIAKKEKVYPKRKVLLPEEISPSYPNASIAKILYRSPSQWSDYFWINLGSQSNKNQNIIALNSPVLYDGYLIGVVDYVGKKQSRVQLITSADLSLSVRALRGIDQYKDVLEALNTLSTHPLVHERESLKYELNYLETEILRESQNWYLAKGELYGTSEPLWRSKSQTLIGRGFNCQEGDAKGVARDLFTGRSLDAYGIEIPLLKTGDLLITTGLDGIFPEGLEVARVTQVDPLTEGAFAYSLKATPLVRNLNELRFVEVILPLDFKKERVDLRAFME